MSSGSSPTSARIRRRTAARIYPIVAFACHSHPFFHVALPLPRHCQR
jgi:hypothetical protein